MENTSLCVISLSLGLQIANSFRFHHDFWNSLDQLTSTSITLLRINLRWEDTRFVCVQIFMNMNN